jgi:two-component system, OmpR family, phosphate regulon sensor histidine kinase PhoR
MIADRRHLTVFILGVIAVASVLLMPPGAAAIVVAASLLLAAIVLMTGGRAPSLLDPALIEEAEDALAVESMRDLIRLLDVLREGVLLLGEEQVVLSANDAAARILGRTPEQMVGLSLIRAARDHELVQLLRESSGLLSEVSLHDGRLVLASATPFVLGPVRTLLTLQDVTALRRAERARQDLVANVSHELRTPITAALALAETLQEGVGDPDQAARFHQSLTTELERLTEIVERLLRLSRIESQAEVFQLETVDVDDLLDEVVAHMAPVASRADITLAHIAEPRGMRVRADRARVIEVLTNLVDNALRFSPPGGTVSIDAAADRAMVRLSVRDQGPGILPSERLRVFERFYTGESSRAAGSRTGTGLGLAIARHIVSRHGGEIWVADASPGATLCFTLPAVDATRAGAAPAEPEAQPAHESAATTPQG